MSMTKNNWDKPLPKKRVFKSEATLLKRLLAAIVDVIILLFIVVQPYANVLKPDVFEMSSITIFAMAMISVLFFIYFLLFQYYLQQTPGMMLLKLYMEGEIGFKSSFIRSLIAIPTFPFYLLLIIEPIMLLLKKRPVLETLSNTTTVQKM